MIKEHEEMERDYLVTIERKKELEEEVSKLKAEEEA